MTLEITRIVTATSCKLLVTARPKIAPNYAVRTNGYDHYLGQAGVGSRRQSFLVKLAEMMGHRWGHPRPGPGLAGPPGAAGADGVPGRLHGLSGGHGGHLGELTAPPGGGGVGPHAAVPLGADCPGAVTPHVAHHQALALYLRHSLHSRATVTQRHLLYAPVDLPHDGSLAPPRDVGNCRVEFVPDPVSHAVGPVASSFSELSPHTDSSSNSDLKTKSVSYYIGGQYRTVIDTHVKISLCLRDIPLPSLQGVVGGADVVVADGKIVVASADPGPVLGHSQGHRVVAVVRVGELSG